MIQKVKIVNFQSHEESSFECDKNLTVFIGESDVGKSSIMRSIDALTERGPFYVTNGKLSGKIEINFDNTTVSRNVLYANVKKCSACKEPLTSTGTNVRCKCGEVNSVQPMEDFYMLDSEKIEKFGIKLNDKLLNAIRMKPVTFIDLVENLNYSKQHDDHFFVGSSYIGSKRNKIISSLLVDSDKIDLLIQSTASKLRESNSRLDVVNSMIFVKREKAEQSKSGIESLKEIRVKIDSNKKELYEKKLSLLQNIQNNLERFKHLEKLSQLSAKLSTGLKGIQERINNVKGTVKESEALNRINIALQAIRTPAFTPVEIDVDTKNFHTLQSTFYKLDSLSDSLEQIDVILKTSIERFESGQEEVKTLESEKNKIIDAMDICPFSKIEMKQECKEHLKGS